MMSILSTLSQLIKITRLKKQNTKISTLQLFTGYFIFLCFFVGLPQIIRQMWPALLTKFTTNQIYYGSLMSINVGVFWVLCFGFIQLQKKEIPALQKYKITNKKWPWQQDNQKWKQLLKRTAQILLLHGIILPSIFLFLVLLKPLPYNFSLENWPSTLTMGYQILIGMLVQDCLFYFSHRMLHHPKFYWIHKPHHEYTQTVIIAAQYAHFIEFILSGIIPTVSGLLILSSVTEVHFVTLFIWILYRTLQGCIGHCGYDLCFDPGNLLPFAIGADHHDFHHAQNCGNYGSLFMFWDALCGTQRDYVKWLQNCVKHKTQNKLN